jgi:hypothetical protein
MSTSSEIKLPLCTSSSDKGPLLKFEDGTLELNYDASGENHKRHWATIRFAGVLAYSYVEDGSHTLEQQEGYNKLVCKSESLWRSQIIQRWEESYGDHAYQKELGGSVRFKHYNVYFDHHGAVDVIASGFEIEK